MTEQIEQTLMKSSRKRRIAAIFIDHSVMSFLMVSIIFIIMGPNFMDEKNQDSMTTIMLLVMIPGFIIYFAKDSIKGISVGRWIMGIMIRNETDFKTTPSFWKMFIRNLFIIIWPIEFIVLAAGNDKKRIGDIVTKTIVIKNPNKPKRLPRIITLIGLGAVFFSFTFLFTGSAMKSSDAYKVAIQNIEANKEIIEETGGITGYGMMPAGNVSITNGQGQVQLQIKVIGNIKSLKVSLYLEKEPNGQWKLIEMNK
ncbi:MAG: RDD family protein [Bacteroidales bacterium]|nr:RDD family protein [Bacteroidales bacterium]